MPQQNELSRFWTFPTDLVFRSALPKQTVPGENCGLPGFVQIEGFPHFGRERRVSPPFFSKAAFERLSSGSEGSATSQDSFPEDFCETLDRLTNLRNPGELVTMSFQGNTEFSIDNTFDDVS
ncbi:hypothetical protein CEXT_156051 [Caerostris extrusa]|uniref:Uncharacterized protein n=1 Tax=Caerostris extrusa TaxID=172846 RepID=A0AAV4Q9U4_CAEEX|nr:hypothetical protein CEXT_156051 [Caerostris extrusa]